MVDLRCEYAYNTPDGLIYTMQACMGEDTIPFKALGYNDMFIPKEYYDALKGMLDARAKINALNRPMVYIKVLEHKFVIDGEVYNCYSPDMGWAAYCDADEQIYPVLSYTRRLKEE